MTMDEANGTGMEEDGGRRPGDVAQRSVNPAAEQAAHYRPAPVLRAEHAEGSVTRIIEQQTAKIPSHWFLAGAMGAMLVSAALEVTGHTRWSRFVGMWSPTLLICGVYNKLVKALPVLEEERRRR